MKKILLALVVALSATVSGCADDAHIASHNLSKQADMFQLNRRIIFQNTWTGEYMLSIEGLCSIENLTNRVAITCKVSPTKFKKHYLGLTGNVTYFSEQLEANTVSTYNYKVIFKPSVIIPDIDVVL